MNIKQRIGKIERMCGIHDPVETLDFGDGQVFRIRQSELRCLFREILDSGGSRILPGDGARPSMAKHTKPNETGRVGGES